MWSALLFGGDYLASFFSSTLSMRKLTDAATGVPGGGGGFLFGASSSASRGEGSSSGMVSCSQDLASPERLLLDWLLTPSDEAEAARMPRVTLTFFFELRFMPSTFLRWRLERSSVIARVARVEQ